VALAAAGSSARRATIACAIDDVKALELARPAATRPPAAARPPLPRPDIALRLQS